MKRLAGAISLTICGLLVSSCNVAADGEPSEADIVALCVNTINAYAHARDAGEGEAFGALFAEDAVMRTPGGEPTGREAIVSAMQARAANGPSGHMVTSASVTVSASGAITAQSYSLVSEGEADGVADTLRVQVRYEDKMTLQNGVCLFTERALTVVPLATDS